MRLDVIVLRLEAVHAHGMLLELITHELVYHWVIAASWYCLLLLLLFPILIDHLGPCHGLFLLDLEVLTPVVRFSLLVPVEGFKLLINLL